LPDNSPLISAQVGKVGIFRNFLSPNFGLVQYLGLYSDNVTAKINGWNRAVGILFTPSVSPPRDYDGKFKWVQLILQQRTTVVPPGKPSLCGTELPPPPPNTPTAPSLDNAYPYSDVADNGSAYDGPNTPLTSQYVKKDTLFYADMYLMWQASSRNTASSSPSIPVVDLIDVPLAYVYWGFEGAATLDSTGCSATFATPTDLIVQGQVLYPKYPEWPTIAINGLLAVNGLAYPCR
jgi:hypothetical protein